MGYFFAELKQRSVLRVALAYVAVSWLLIQVVETLFPIFGLSDALIRVVVIVLAIGFPLALVFSWLYALTPEGLKLESNVDNARSQEHHSGKKFDRAIIIVLTIAFGYFAFDKFVLDPARDVQREAVVARQARSGALVESYGDHSIAVLPFLNMSDDASNEYFADGISEELLNLLARIPQLRVISRSSAFSFKGKDIVVPEVAEKLNVGHVLEGSVRKFGNRVRITAQLIEARSDTHLWSKTYDRTLDDIFLIQDEIAAAVVEQLKITLLGPAPVSKVVGSETYRLYLLGQHHLNKWVPAEVNKAIQYFQQAIDLDPEYAEAYVGLASCYGVIGFYGFMPPQGSFEKEIAAIEKALQIDGNLADPHWAYGTTSFYYEWKWQQAEEEFLRAIALNSNLAAAYQFQTWFLVAMGRTEEADTSIERALRLDPLAIPAYLIASDVSYMSRQYDRAVTQLKRVLDLDPGHPMALARLGWSYVQLGRHDEAINVMKQAVASSPGNMEPLWMLGHAYATAGKTVEAREILDKLQESAEERYVLPYGFAMIHLGLGENDAALEWMEKAYQDRNAWMPYMRVEPRLDPLRTDARFQDLLRRMNFPESPPGNQAGVAGQ